MTSANEERNNIDSELILRYRNSRDLTILAGLYEHYMPMVFGVCLKYLKNREESQDAVMQIFEKLVELLPRHEVVFFRSWLYTLTRNHCLMELRSRKGRYFEEIQVNLMETDGHLHQEEGPEFETNMSNLEKCIEELVIEQKRCVQLFYLQQKCYREISEVTGYDGNKVKSYIQNGKRNLKICMERHERY